MHLKIEKVKRLLSQAKLLNAEDKWERAKQAKNRTKRLYTKKQNAIIFRICEKNKQNPKTFWRTINVILPNKKQSDNNILLKDQTNNEIIPDNDIPNFINTYFTSIGFRPKHSAQSAIAQFTDYIYTNIDNNRITNNRISNKILYTKMKYFVVKGMHLKS